MRSLPVSGATNSTPGSAGRKDLKLCLPAAYYPSTKRTGLVWARLMAEGKAKGRPRGGLDTIIAAIAEANDCIVVTDNERDFEDIQVINPMRGAT